MTDKIARFLSKVSRGYGEATLLTLFDVLNIPDSVSTLSKVQLVAEGLNQMGLKMVPYIDQGEIDSVRQVKFADDIAVTVETIRLELTQRESDCLEFKSSLVFDHDRAKAQPDVPRKLMKSDDVLHSSLKTIAAFLTGSGGTLLIGVDDNGSLLGIRHDFLCMTEKPERQNEDGWELVFRDYVRSRFKDGSMINDYVHCTILLVDGESIARISVSPRRQLSFLQAKGAFALYKRQGNRTVQVSIEQIEEFIDQRKRLFD